MSTWGDARRSHVGVRGSEVRERRRRRGGWRWRAGTIALVKNWAEQGLEKLACALVGDREAKATKPIGILATIIELNSQEGKVHLHLEN
jgi:hypothetical protein